MKTGDRAFYGFRFWTFLFSVCVVLIWARVRYWVQAQVQKAES